MLAARLRASVRSSWWGLILIEHDTEPTEMAGGVMKLLLASLLLAPADTFGTSMIYGLLRVMPEWLWGLVMASFGIAHLAALRSGHREWRRVMALAGFLIWFTWAVSFALGGPTNTGSVVYGLAALMQGWCYVRLGRPA